MSLISPTASRPLIRRIRQGQWNASLQFYRSYSTPRNPRSAEEEAATVRGNRAARARLEEHKKLYNASQNEYKEGRTFEGKTLGGKGPQLEAE